jgi:DNA-directed RNA polymerase specialized sigma24 family protein
MKNPGMPQHLSGREMSCEEIADQLGILPGTVRTILQCGLVKLRSRFPLQLRQLLAESQAMRR